MLDSAEDVNVFHELESYLATVENSLIEDENRIQDVAKIVNVILKDLILKDSLPEEIEGRLAERKRSQTEK